MRAAKSPLRAGRPGAAGASKDAASTPALPLRCTRVALSWRASRTFPREPRSLDFAGSRTAPTATQVRIRRHSAEPGPSDPRLPVSRDNKRAHHGNAFRPQTTARLCGRQSPVSASRELAPQRPRTSRARYREGMGGQPYRRAPSRGAGGRGWLAGHAQRGSALRARQPRAQGSVVRHPRRARTGGAGDLRQRPFDVACERRERRRLEPRSGGAR
jgi:hypothetical protein